MGPGVCAVLRGRSLGCPGPTGGLGMGQMQGRGGVVGWGVGGHSREKRPPQPLGAGSRHRVGHPHRAPSPALRRVACQRREAAGCGDAGLRSDTYSGVGWLSVAVPGSLGPGSLGPLCSEGGKATEGVCQLWAGAAAELRSWLRSVAREARGPAEVWANPWFSSSGRYCTEQEEVPVGRKGTRPAFSFCPFHTPGIRGFFQDWSLQKGWS